MVWCLRNLVVGPLSGPLCYSVMRLGVFCYPKKLQSHPVRLKWFCLTAPHSGPSDAPIRLIKNYTKKAFPNLTYSSTQEWIGFRPATPDSTTLIGQVAQSGVFTGFGHQHIGLTAGPKTGSLLAQLITGQIPSMDMSPYTPERYLVSW